MRLFIIAGVLLVSSAVAHARRTTTFDLVGWSADGTSAMLTRHVSEDNKMGDVFGYVVVTASDSTPLEVTTRDTLAADPQAADKIDATACSKAADTLAKAIAAKKFKRLTIEKKECKGTVRTVVHTTSEVDKTDSTWWVSGSSAKVHNPPTKREAAALAAGASITSTQADIAASPVDGNLVLVFYGGSEGLVFAFLYKGKLVAKDL